MTIPTWAAIREQDQPFGGLRLLDRATRQADTRDYPVLEYTVQYRESDLDFARRQMERAGISFHFRHAVGSHTLVSIGAQS